MNIVFAFHITCFIAFTLLPNAQQKKLKDEDDQKSTQEEDDDLTREEQNYYSDHYSDNLPGAPQLDYPIFTSIPRTGFSCQGKINWQYYADIETDCQVFHICETQYSKISFLCPEGTIFNQRHLVCDWWYNVECTDAVDLYTLGNELGDQAPSDGLVFDDRGRFDLSLASSGGNKGPDVDSDAKRKLPQDENKTQRQSKPITRQRE